MTTPQGRIFQAPGVQLFWRDNVELMRFMRADSIDLIVTSPPYDDLRTYGGPPARAGLFGLVATLEVLRQCQRILKPGGVICWNVGDSVVGGGETLSSAKQKIYAVEECGLLCHDTMIYEKNNFSAPENTRYHQTFEYIFIFSKGKPLTFNPIHDRKNITHGRRPWGITTKRNRDGTQVRTNDANKVSREFGKRTNVWKGNTAGQEQPCKSLPHPAMMPSWLARDLIISWSNPGHWVFDPYAGSGTTLIQGYKLGRRVAGCDDSRGYCMDTAKVLRALCQTK